MGKVIGVTGGIASGKSLFVSLLSELGAQVVSADEIARNLMEKGSTAFKRVVEAFGEDILTSTGEIDRPKLAEIVFNSDASREILNAIVHPEVILEVERIIRDFQGRIQDKGCIVIEVPLLLECGMQKMFDITVVVTAEQEIRKRRLTDIRLLSPEQAEARMQSQLSEQVKCELADVVIINDESADNLRAKASCFAEKYCDFQD